MNPLDHRLPSLSIVLPCFNERANLRAFVERAFQAGQACSRESEIIIVAGGSTDGTPEEALLLGRQYANLRLIIHDRNLGYGAAVMNGLRSARMEYVFFTDADGQFDPSEIANLVPALDGNSGVLGYRIQRQDSVGRRALGSVYTRIIQTVFRVRCRDINCAFKLFPTSVVAGLPMHSRGALFNAELLAWLQREGRVFAEVGVYHYRRLRGRQSGARLDVVARAIAEFVLIIWEVRVKKWRRAGRPVAQC